MYITSSEFIVYLAAPANRKRDIDYYLDAFTEDSDLFARQIGYSPTTFVEFGFDSGAPLSKRPILKAILEESWWQGPKRRHLVVPFYECLSPYSSDFVAFKKDLALCGLDVGAFYEPELYYRPHLRCGSALGNDAPWPGHVFDGADGWRPYDLTTKGRKE